MSNNLIDNGSNQSPTFQRPTDGLSIGIPVEMTYQKELQRQIADTLGWKDESFPASRPVTFTKKHFENLLSEDYFVCERNFGRRIFLYISNTPKGPAVFLVNSDNSCHYLPMFFPTKEDRRKHLTNTLIDGEMVSFREGNKTLYRYLAFDLMAINGKNVAKLTINHRLGLLRQDVLSPYHAMLQAFPEMQQKSPFAIELKKMDRSYGVRNSLEQIKFSQHVTGFVFVPVQAPYIPGVNNKMLKWTTMNGFKAIFRIHVQYNAERKPEYFIQARKSHTLYDYSPIDVGKEMLSEWRQTSPNGRNCECIYDPNFHVTVVEKGYAPVTKIGGWRFIRFQEDNVKLVDFYGANAITAIAKEQVTSEEILQMLDQVRVEWKQRERFGATNAQSIQEKRVLEEQTQDSTLKKEDGPLSQTEEKAVTPVQEKTNNIDEKDDVLAEIQVTINDNPRPVTEESKVNTADIEDRLNSGGTEKGGDSDGGNVDNTRMVEKPTSKFSISFILNSADEPSEDLSNPLKRRHAEDERYLSVSSKQHRFDNAAY